MGSTGTLWSQPETQTPARMKWQWDPLDLDRLLEPVHRLDIVVVQLPGIIDLSSTQTSGTKKNRRG